MRILVAMVGAIVALTGTTGYGQHWPHWRGPTHNGVVSGETNLPVTWGAECAPTSRVLLKRAVRWTPPTPCPRRRRRRAGGAGGAAARKGGRSCR